MLRQFVFGNFRRRAATPEPVRYEPLEIKAVPLRLVIQPMRQPCACGQSQRRTYIAWLYAGYKVRQGVQSIERRTGPDGKPRSYFCVCQVDKMENRAPA